MVGVFSSGGKNTIVHAKTAMKQRSGKTTTSCILDSYVFLQSLVAFSLISLLLCVRFPVAFL
jgi:hypothetical protein